MAGRERREKCLRAHVPPPASIYIIVRAHFVKVLSGGVKSARGRHLKGRYKALVNLNINLSRDFFIS